MKKIGRTLFSIYKNKVEEIRTNLVNGGNSSDSDDNSDDEGRKQETTADVVGGGQAESSSELLTLFGISGIHSEASSRLIGHHRFTLALVLTHILRSPTSYFT